MTTRLNLCLLLIATAAAALLIFVPLYAQGPCFEVAPMSCRQGVQNAYPGIKSCRSCRCGENRICPCDVGVVNYNMARVPTGRNCTQTRGVPCADDFDLVRNPDGSIKETKCATIQACGEFCTVFEINRRLVGHRCVFDREAQARAVRCSHYRLTGRGCPKG